MTRGTSAAALVVSLAVLSHATTALAQGWSADVSAGRLVDDPLSTNVATNNLIGSLRYDTRAKWVYGAIAAPWGERATVWGAVGAGGRVMLSGSLVNASSVGVDLGAHGFWFHDRVLDRAGTGATVEAIPFTRLSAGNGFVEGRAGWRGHTLSFEGARENRGVFETGARGGYGTTVSVEADALWVHATEGTYPFVGATIAYQGSPLQVWGQVGKWLATDLSERAWGLGSSARIGARTSVWASVRREAPDPLYWNASRRSWSVGLTQRLGRISVPLVRVAQSDAGPVVVRLRATEAPAGAVAIAGDFNNWQAASMQREGGDWIARLPLRPGVYKYTFRSAAGDWFVPPSTVGRREDGMGGYVAVLVVN